MMGLSKAIFYMLRLKSALITFLTLLFVPTVLLLLYSTTSKTTNKVINHAYYKSPRSDLKNTSLMLDGALFQISSAVPGECDIFDGKWVDDGGSFFRRYEPGSCPFVDVSFNCFTNGRTDLNYTRLRWQPNECDLPRWNGRKMLEMLRDKRLTFVGDSLNRNMWESLVCMLRESVTDKTTLLDISGKHEFRTVGFYSVRFSDYNCTIEFFRSPFLVREWSVTDRNGVSKNTLRLDVVPEESSMYKDADIIVFNTAHWWTHEKTSLGKDFYQEGEYVHGKLSALEAYRKALNTWANWVDGNINGNRTQIFFRGYSTSHFSGGRWNAGGNCHGETLPLTNRTQLKKKHPQMMTILQSVLEQMYTNVKFMNITQMTFDRKDGHPSVYRRPAEERKQNSFQDCSHWCLPGVPDAWNHLLFSMLAMENSMRGRKNRAEQTFNQ